MRKIFFLVVLILMSFSIFALNPAIDYDSKILKLDQWYQFYEKYSGAFVVKVERVIKDGNMYTFHFYVFNAYVEDTKMFNFMYLEAVDSKYYTHGVAFEIDKELFLSSGDVPPQDYRRAIYSFESNYPLKQLVIYGRVFELEEIEYE